MNRIKKIILFSFLFGVLLSPLFFVQAVENPTEDIGASTPKISPPIDFPKLSVKLPGLNFDKAVCTSTECSNNWLAEYIQALYQYGIGIIGILAVITMMVGGIIWVTAAGNDQHIVDAKKWIGGSLMGVLIALTSYVILNMVNPALTVLSPIKLKYIAKIELPLGPVGSDDVIESPSDNPFESGSVGSVGGSCFPVERSSFSYISWNWGSRRSSGKRCHAAVDIYTKSPGRVLAIAPGTVINVYNFYGCSQGWSGGGMTMAVIVDHGNYVVNYGEINQGKVAVKIGDKVQAGTVLGVAGHCGMVHFELYKSGTSQNNQWWPPSGKSVGSESNYCRSNYLATKPGELLDATETIKSLESKMCGN
mgnify:CR=1 FL=1